MNKIKLDARLLCVASLVKKNSRLIDVGTDHGYLPVYLLQNEICKSAIACDVKKMPLANAASTIEKNNLQGKIQTVLSDGLKKISVENGDTIVLAGMGGELIEKILSSCPAVKKPDVEIIAQPMTHAEQVRLFFLKNGFEIEKEKACSCAGHCYCVIKAHYVGFSDKNEFSAGFAYFGKLAENDDEDSLKYISNQYNRLKKKADALLKSGKNKDEYDKLCMILKDFENETEVKL